MNGILYQMQGLGAILQDQISQDNILPLELLIRIVWIGF